MNVLKKIFGLMKRKPTKGSDPSQQVEQLGMIHKRIAQYANDYPEATEYVLNTEEEAKETLYAMCSVLTCMVKESHGKQARTYLSEIRRLKGVIARRQALGYIGNNGYSMFGLVLVGLSEVEA